MLIGLGFVDIISLPTSSQVRSLSSQSFGKYWQLNQQQLRRQNTYKHN